MYSLVTKLQPTPQAFYKQEDRQRCRETDTTQTERQVDRQRCREIDIRKKRVVDTNKKNIYFFLIRKKIDIDIYRGRYDMLINGIIG